MLKNSVRFILPFLIFILLNPNEPAIQIVEATKEEIKFYEKYKSYYSYGFYIAKKL